MPSLPEKMFNQQVMSNIDQIMSKIYTYLQGKFVGSTPARGCNFVSIIADVFDSQLNVNTLGENKGGLALTYHPRSTVPAETKVGSNRVYLDHYQTLRSK